MVRKITVKKILSDEETKALEGQRLPKGYYKTVIKDEDVDEYLSNNDNFSEELDQKLGEAEFETGFGLNGNMNDFDEEHETRFDVYNSKGEAIWGGHC